MATDEHVMGLVGQQVPRTGRQRCPICSDGGYDWQIPAEAPIGLDELVVVGAWHPEGRTGAYLVLGCLRYKATVNGGAP